MASGPGTGQTARHGPAARTRDGSAGCRELRGEATSGRQSRGAGSHWRRRGAIRRRRSARPSTSNH